MIRYGFWIVPIQHILPEIKQNFDSFVQFCFTNSGILAIMEFLGKCYHSVKTRERDLAGSGQAPILQEVKCHQEALARERENYCADEV